MLSSAQLRKIREDARPYIQRQMDDAKIIAGFRDVVTAAGGDWSALKALIKAEVQDETDDAGDAKKIGKVVGKADWTRLYAEMLGLVPSMNEKNSFADDQDYDPETGEVSPSEAAMLPQTGPGVQGPFTVSAGQAAVESPATQSRPVVGADGAAAPYHSDNTAGTPLAGAGIDVDRQPIHEPVAIPPVDPSSTVATEAGDRSAVPPPSAAPVVASNVTAFRTHNPATHFLNSKGLPRLHGCLNAEACGGSPRALCFSCSVRHEGPAFQGGAA